jgi:hypothetical protein
MALVLAHGLEYTPAPALAHVLGRESGGPLALAHTLEWARVGPPHEDAQLAPEMADKPPIAPNALERHLLVLPHGMYFFGDVGWTWP